MGAIETTENLTSIVVISWIYLDTATERQMLGVNLILHYNIEMYSRMSAFKHCHM